MSVSKIGLHQFQLIHLIAFFELIELIGRKIFGLRKILLSLHHICIKSGDLAHQPALDVTRRCILIYCKNGESTVSISEKMTNFVHKQGCVWTF